MTDKKLAEVVEHDGTTLYAPVVACRPIRPQNYPPSYLRTWKEMSAAVGFEPVAYSDSTPDECEACHIAVWVGPRQLGAMQGAHDLGLATHVTCLVCAALLTSEIDEDAILNLGNHEHETYPTENCPLCSRSPFIRLADGHQSICDNEDCRVVFWDAHKTLEQNLTEFDTIDLSDLEPPDVH